MSSGSVTYRVSRCWQGTSYGYSRARVSRGSAFSTSVGLGEVDNAITRSRHYLLGLQNIHEGYWVGEVESNSTITSEYIFLMHFMGTVDVLRQRKMVHYLQETQLPDGSWNIFFGAPGDLSATVEAYAAMKLAGEKPESRFMRLAREFVCDNGGMEKARVFTKIFLALLGAYPWEQCPALPPELMLVPVGLPLNIYEMSSWARSTVVPLLIVWHYKPVLKRLGGFRLDELSWGAKTAPEEVRLQGALDGWGRFFVLLDRLAKIYERRPVTTFRQKALRLAEQWVIERQEPSGDWGGIMPAMMSSLIALRCRGYSLSHPVIVKGLEAVSRFAVEDSRTLRLQSCVSPVWDTANACLALLESGVPIDHPALEKARSWLWTKQVRVKGDWAVKRSRTEPGGWSFEFENRFYPDVDDTLAVLTVLNQGCSRPDQAEAWHAGLRWLLAMQCKNGGWGAFDVDNDQEIWNRIPFADHKSMLDPPTSDLTGRVLEFLGTVGYRSDVPAARKAIEFLEAQQEPDGSWFGRWGVNYLYGTWCALCGLKSIGYPMDAPRVRKAVRWIMSCQNPDGGWGESCLSYEDSRYKGKGTSTASQTAWALMGLVAAGEAASEAAERGVAFLLDRQNRLGSWDEEEFTGTGFPKFFYLRYHMYRDYFPLMALSRFRKARWGLGVGIGMEEDLPLQVEKGLLARRSHPRQHSCREDVSGPSSEGA